MHRTALTLSILGMTSAFLLLIVNARNAGTSTNDLQAQVSGESSSSSAFSVPTYRCFDTDAGETPDKAGAALIQHAERGITTKENDSCNGKTLREFYCVSDSSIGEKFHECPYGCATGACNPEPTTVSPTAINVCPTDTFACADGSTVSRDPFNGCRFKACTAVKNTSTTSQEGVSRITSRQQSNMRAAAPPAPSSSSQKSLSARCMKLSAARRAKTKGCH